MTVETTSFLANSKIANNGSEKSAKILKSQKNVVIFLLAAILLIFCLLASILQIWIFHRMNGMQKEIDQLRINIELEHNEMDQLKDKIEIMENNIEKDRKMYKEIVDFNREYNHNQNGIKDDIDMDENINLPDEKNKFDDVGEDVDDEDEYSENSEEYEDESFNGHHSGYGDDYDAEDDDYDLNENGSNDSPKEENNIYKDMEKHTRRTRSIAGVTHQGIPIVDEPYALRRNRTRYPNDANDPKLKLTWNGHSRSNSRREHSERSRQHHTVRHHHNRFAFAAAPVHHSFESYGQRFNDTPTTSTDKTPSIPIQSRQSRVMHFEDKSKAFRQVVGKDQLAKLQEQRMPPEHYVRHSAMAPRRPMRKNLELKNAKRMKITAVHFDGDSSKLEETSHYSYKGNKKVELNKDQYLHWKPADWVYSHGMAKYFQMDSSGTLTVNDHGLFLIYAQVLYHDSHDLNGYVIEHNGDEHYKCITMTHTGTRSEKTNSCYTSGLIHLRNGDKIRLRDLANHRNVFMDKAKSYFGLIKINLIPSVSSAESSEIGRAVVK